MHNLSRLIAASLMIAISADSLRAQSTTAERGFHLGAALNGSMINWDDADESDNGPGLSVYGAYNFTRNISLVLGVTAASIKPEGDERFRLMHTDVGVRYSLRGSSAFAPYAEAGYSLLNAKGDVDEGNLQYKGSGFTGTLGGNYFFSPKLALDLNLRYMKGEFDTVKIDGASVPTGGELSVSTTRLNIGFAFFL